MSTWRRTSEPAQRIVTRTRWRLSDVLLVVRKFVRATLRGVRDYCNAYHRGPNRDEITRILAQYSDVKDPALINQIEWGATDVHGRIFEASVSDIQDTFFKERLVADRVPIGRIAPSNAWSPRTCGPSRSSGRGAAPSRSR